MACKSPTSKTTAPATSFFITRVARCASVCVVCHQSSEETKVFCAVHKKQLQFTSEARGEVPFQRLPLQGRHRIEYYTFQKEPLL